MFHPLPNCQGSLLLGPKHSRCVSARWFRSVLRVRHIANSSHADCAPLPTPAGGEVAGAPAVKVKQVSHAHAFTCVCRCARVMLTINDV